MALREYRSNVFSMLLEDKRNALQVYNALNGSVYQDCEQIEIKRLENGIVLSLRNDASFIIDGQLNIYEQQSTFNPNMALRELIYYVEIIKPLVLGRDLYGKKPVLIPTPHFCVFYNGTENRPAEESAYLSDAFEKQCEKPELEVVCRVININPDKNAPFLAKCPVLKEYMSLIGKVSRNRDKGIGYKEAIESAVEECIEGNILAEFLKTRRNEVLEAMTIDMTWERREELIRREERAEGKTDGELLKLIDLVCRKVSKDYPIERIADELEEQPETIKSIYEEAVKQRPNYRRDAILEALKG